MSDRYAIEPFDALVVDKNFRGTISFDQNVHKLDTVETEMWKMMKNVIVASFPNAPMIVAIRLEGPMPNWAVN